MGFFLWCELGGMGGVKVRGLMFLETPPHSHAQNFFFCKAVKGNINRLFKMNFLVFYTNGEGRLL